MNAHRPKERILITDHPWPDLDLETTIASAAGFELIGGPIEAGDAAHIEKMIEQHDPIAIMTCWAQVSAAAIAKPTQLKIVARLGVGLDNIAIDAVTQRGAWVTNVPDYCVEEVSDHAIAMMLASARGIVAFDREAKQGMWNPSSARLNRVRNLTVGVIGYGHIGRATARKLAQGFNCRVLVNSPSLLRAHAPGAEIFKGIHVGSIEAIQAQADVIILHLPLTPNTHHMINDAFIAACVKKPLLINVSRGGLIDNAALVRALDAKQLAAAALDVVEGEPTPPLTAVGRDDVIVTPHIAFSSAASLAELRQRCTEDVVRVLRGEAPLHPCNKPSVI